VTHKIQSKEGQNIIWLRRVGGCAYINHNITLPAIIMLMRADRSLYAECCSKRFLLEKFHKKETDEGKI
jgi:hypothetical protein